MGAGKTTVGKQLAKTLHKPFYDSDKAIEKQTGVDIATIFAYEGEAGFREREQTIIKKLTQVNGCIVATGGGTVISAVNRAAIKKNGLVVYLECSLDILLKRSNQRTQRPLLNTQNPKQTIKELFFARRDFYLSCADFKIETSNMDITAIVKNILRAYAKYKK